MITTISPIGLKYRIDPSAKVSEVVHELQLLTESARFTIEAQTDNVPQVLSVLYALRQISDLIDALDEMLPGAASLEALRGNRATSGHSQEAANHPREPGRSGVPHG